VTQFVAADDRILDVGYGIGSLEERFGLVETLTR